MRIKTTIENISYTDTQEFFDNRVKKYEADNPYGVTMYQDNNPGLVKERNEKEVCKLLPKLRLDDESRILDVACGIGRWSDAISRNVNRYCGTDFCKGLIELAKSRNEDKQNRVFYTSRNEMIAETLEQKGEGKFNRVLLIGALMYLNDEDAINTLMAIESVCEKNTIICIREPIGLEERLTLKENFSEELNDNYNAIYRTRNELMEMFEKAFVQKGFAIEEESFLFDDANLNNRKETSQYYFILRRNG